MNQRLRELLFVVTVSGSLFACTSNPSKEHSYADILSSPLFAGITDSINRDPKNVDLLLRRATRLSQNNLHQAATADYKKAWELSPDENTTQQYASNLLLASNTKEAVRVLEEGKRKFAGNSEFSRRLGEIYLQNGLYYNALKEYDKMIQGDSTNFEAWYDKGNALLKVNDTAQAVDALERSFALLPINYSGIALANLYIALKDPRALDICDILLSRDSTGTLTDPVYMKGVYYSETNDEQKALKEFDECIRRDWKMTDAYIEKGIIYFEKKDYPTALKTFNLAATVSNTDADAYFWMGRSYEALGQLNEAITNYRRALSLDNSFSEAKEALRRLNS